MKKITLIILFLSALILSGCKVDSVLETTPATIIPDPVKEILPADYFPMTPGSTWSYIGEGNEFASYTQTVLYNECSYFQVSKNNGGTVSSMVYYVSDIDVRLVLSKGEEYEMANLISEAPNTDEIILMAPIEPGTEWGSESIKRKIVSVDESKYTSAGLFEDCLMVRSDYPDSYIIDYYALGVGLVYSEFHSGDYIVTSSLESYTIAD